MCQECLLLYLIAYTVPDPAELDADVTCCDFLVGVGGIFYIIGMGTFYRRGEIGTTIALFAACFPLIKKITVGRGSSMVGIFIH